MQAIFILDSKGKILISRNYRGVVSNNIVSRFVQRLLEDEDVNLRPVSSLSTLRSIDKSIIVIIIIIE
jgi:DNA-binding transcriptional regulator/RsmH inhibitor MraZ